MEILLDGILNRIKIGVKNILNIYSIQHFCENFSLIIQNRKIFRIEWKLGGV